MRILLIIHQFYPEFCGGTERVTLNIAKSLQRAGHYVKILACSINPDLVEGKPYPDLSGSFHSTYNGIPLVFLPRKSLPATADYSFECDSTQVKNIESWIKKERFDLAHVMHPMRMASALLAVQQAGLPYLLTLTDFFSACFHINLINTKQQLCEGPQAGTRCVQDCLVAPWDNETLTARYLHGQGVLSGAGARICPSDYVASRYRTIFPNLEFAVIPHGIDLIAFSAKHQPKVSKKSELTLGYIGTIIPQKGLDTLLRAFVQISDSTLKLRIVGGFYGDPVYHKEIQSLINSDPRIELVGQVPPDQVGDIIRTVDILCLPSRVPETFSLILHESAAFGVPAIVSDIGAPAELITKHGAGKVVPVDNIDSWKEAIIELVSNPEQLEIWRAKLPLPLRIEEEAFFYESHYRRLMHSENHSSNS
jgi:glycosyltransferase involved in cell wall biosynthesis